jgi:transitional endoplasmic reticulum ATPase
MPRSNNHNENDIEACRRKLLNRHQEPCPDQRLSDLRGLDNLIDKVTQTIIDPHCSGHAVAAASTALFRSQSATTPTTVPRAVAGELGANGYTVFKLNLQARDHSQQFRDREHLALCLEALTHERPAVLLLEGFEAIHNGHSPMLNQRLADLSQEPAKVVVLAVENGQGPRRGQGSQWAEVIDVTVTVPVPDQTRRAAILKDAIESAAAASDNSVDTEKIAFEEYAADLEGCNTGWLERVGKRAVTLTVAAQHNHVTDEQVETAVNQVTDERFGEDPSQLPRGQQDTESRYMIDTPDVSFDDIGGLDGAIERIQEIVATQQQHMDVFEAAGLSTSHGLLLAGPPGTGKTLLAKAVANELDRTFLSVKGPELKHPLYGMSERSVRELFEKADEQAPCVLFFDEFDAIAGDRNAISHGATESIVATLLTELDGIEGHEELLVLAATNRPEAIDDAVLRRGRLDEVVDVPVPDEDAQAEIFAIHSDPLPIADDITAEWFSSVTPAGMTGADIASVCKQAFQKAVSDADDEQSVQITRTDLCSVLDTLAQPADDHKRRYGFE